MAGARQLQSALLLLISTGAVSAQTISVAVTNIPAAATRIVAVADLGAATYSASMAISPGTSTATLPVGAAAGSGYRVRVFADTSTGILRSGKATGITIPAIGSSSVNIALADVVASFDAANPVSAGAGTAAQIRFTITDPGDVVQNQQGLLFGSSTAFTPPGRLAGSTMLGYLSGTYSATFSAAVPVSGSTFYYACRVEISAGAFSSILDLPGGATPYRTMTVTGATNLILQLSNVPSSATQVGVLIDGASGGIKWGTQSVSSPSSSMSVLAGMPAGGPYRVRVFAASASGLLRTGKASSVTAPASGGIVVSIPLADLAVTTDSSTPTQAAAGASINLKFNISDTGDVLESASSELFSAPVSFDSISAATYTGAGILTKLSSGSYTLRFPVTLQSSGTAYYYAWRLYAGTGGALANLDLPRSGGILARSILLTGSSLAVVVVGIPDTATRLTVLVDNGPSTTALQFSQDVPAGVTSSTLSLLAPSAGIYRVRALAFAPAGLLRSGKLDAVTAPATGSPPVLTLGDVAAWVDPSTPATASAGATIPFRFNVTDPGEVLEGRTASVYYGAAPFLAPEGIYLGSAAPVKTGAGSFSISLSGHVASGGPYLYYSMHVPVADALLDSPAAGLPAWQIAINTTCTYSSQPASLTPGASGAAGSLTITASSPACPWNAHDSASWITLSANQTAGSGSLSYTIAANGSAQLRSGVIRAGTLSISVTQPSSSSSCDYTMAAAPSVPSAGGSFSTTMTTAAGCPWSATSANGWITITSGASGTGPGVIAFSVAANSGDIRSGSITAAGRTLTVSQRASYNNDTGFVRQVYRDLLNRDPDATGLSYWTSMLTGGYMTRDQLASSFFQSQEFSQYGLFIVKLYTSVFGRYPDSGGLRYWVGVMTTGTQSMDVVASFIASPEYAQRFGNPDNRNFVIVMYRNVLVRDPDAAGLNYWAGQLDSNAMTRPQLMYSFVICQELDNRLRNPAYSLLLYIGFLARDPESAGFDYWTAVLNQGDPLPGVVSSFIYSAEYRARF